MTSEDARHLANEYVRRVPADPERVECEKNIGVIRRVIEELGPEDAAGAVVVDLQGKYMVALIADDSLIRFRAKPSDDKFRVEARHTKLEPASLDVTVDQRVTHDFGALVTRRDWIVDLGADEGFTFTTESVAAHEMDVRVAFADALTRAAGWRLDHAEVNADLN